MTVIRSVVDCSDSGTCPCRLTAGVVKPCQPTFELGREDGNCARRQSDRRLRDDPFKLIPVPPDYDLDYDSAKTIASSCEIRPMEYQRQSPERCRGTVHPGGGPVCNDHHWRFNLNPGTCNVT